jgi:transcriptional regulator with XRE-family HTH domain
MSLSASPSLLLRLRRHFGLSQDDLAQLLGLTRGMVSMAETGRRALPSEAWLLLTPLLEALEETTPFVAKPLTMEELRPVQRRQQECAFQATALRRTLDRLQQQAVQTARRARAVPALRAAAPGNERVRLWSDWQQAATQQQQAQATPAAQALLVGRIAALQAEAAALAQWLAAAGREPTELH